MKKIIILAIVAVAVTTSCRKDRTCECTYTTVFTPSGGGVGTTVTSTNKVTTTKQKAKDFRMGEECYNWTATQTYTYGTIVDTHNCAVK